MPLLPALPAVPMPQIVSDIFSQFPLISYPSPNNTTPPPSKPTLWIKSSLTIKTFSSASTSNHSNISSPTQSLDPYSLQAQTLARFLNVDHETRYLSTSAGAPGGKLPSLHLPNGELLSSTEVIPWLIEKQGKATTISSNEDPVHQAFTALVQTSVLPAVLAITNLSPSSSSSKINNVGNLANSEEKPFLTGLVESFFAMGERREMISEVKKLRGGSVGTRGVLDLEMVEREAMEALNALESKMKSDGGEWFGNSKWV